MAVASPDVLARMPLADAVLTLWCWVADEAYLDQIFEENRGRCYERILSFPLMVRLIRDALLEHDGSGRKSFEHAEQREELKTSYTAAYGKLGRLPMPVSMAFLSGCTARLTAVFPQSETACVPIPESLANFRPIVFDGKAIKNVAKRLLPLRGATGGLLGARTLVAMDVRTGLVLAMHGHPDGDANDTRFVGDLIPTVRRLVDGRRLWIVDSGFCDLTQTAHFMAAPGDEFIVRYHPKVRFDRDPERPVREGRDRHNRLYSEDWGWLGAAGNRKRRYVRRITLKRPGQKDVIVITSLCDGEAFPATDVLEIYLKRWGIEQIFQQVTEVFGLSALIASTPEGTTFQFALCLLLYNMIQVVRGVIATGVEKPRDTISTENLFDDVQRELIAWNVVVDHDDTLRYFEGEWTSLRVKVRLSELLGGLWRDRWRKAPPKKKKPPHPDRKRDRTHGSVFRIIEAHRKKTARHRAAGKVAPRC
jgi:Transposase DDE domain